MYLTPSQPLSDRALSYQKVFLELPPDEQVILRNRHEEQAVILRKKIKIMIRIYLSETGTKKTEQEMMDFIVNRGELLEYILTQPILLKPIKDLPITNRHLKSQLQDKGFYYVVDLVQKTEEELYMIRSFWRKKIDEIKNILASMNLSLGMELRRKDKAA